MMHASLEPYRYTWPDEEPAAALHWQQVSGGEFVARAMPEDPDDLSQNSRWPAFFPSPISLVTTADGSEVALEKVVGATIVNRFPYVVALSLCQERLSARHCPRSRFCEMLERGGGVAVQFLPPGRDLEAAMGAIASVPDDRAPERIAASGLVTRRANTNDAPVFASSYMVYEARLVTPARDFAGEPIYSTPAVDAGSHRIYFFEITAIQLRADIVAGSARICWRSLPAWKPRAPAPPVVGDGRIQADGYRKGYTPHYSFPSPGTIAFEADEIENGMAIQRLPAGMPEQVEIDNDRARWPCFFPSSLGLITTWADDGVPNVMPCGSTAIVSRHPLMVAPCISYAAINARYAPRATLETIQNTGRFGCGVPFLDQSLIDAITYAGNTSIHDDREKVRHAGLHALPYRWAPVLSELPIHFECAVVQAIPLGTHVMFLGEVRRILVRSDLTPNNRLEWCPWAAVEAPVETRVRKPLPYA